MTAIRLFLVPGLFLLVMLIFQPGVNFRISVLEAGMPLALTPFALAEEYPTGARSNSASGFTQYFTVSVYISGII